MIKTGPIYEIVFSLVIKMYKGFSKDVISINIKVRSVAIFLEQ